MGEMSKFGFLLSSPGFPNKVLWKGRDSLRLVGAKKHH